MASKAKRSRTSARKKATKAQNVSSPDRSRMVAMAAYFIADQRGFLGSNPIRSRMVDADI